MKKLTQKQLDKLIKSHIRWQECKPFGKQLRLSFVDISGLTIGHDDNFEVIRYAHFNTVNMTDVTITNTSFDYCEFDTIEGSNVSINSGYFQQCYIDSVSLQSSDIVCTDCDGSMFNDFDCSGGSITYSNAIKCVLNCFYLHHCKLSKNSIEGSTLSNYYCFDEYHNIVNGDNYGTILTKPVIGYKMLRDNKIAELEIPAGNIVFSINSGKYRTQSAKVLSIKNANTNKLSKSGVSTYDSGFVYTVGATVVADNFDLRYNESCTGGIHFFKTYEEAKAYYD